MNTTVGTCGLCGGAVTVPSFWHSIVPPTPTCKSCGATVAQHGPVLPMQPARKFTTINTTRLSITPDGQFVPAEEPNTTLNGAPDE